ncbi:hypothetical protein O2K51_08405 [Apibacter raozihei]|uniref:hypothetical protein n=1 Tax=Apibacter raozihei TaxID=2500547 RepID=UPI000FE2EE46|nr:hypothetical protein [Apibacter raozihei]
MGLLMLPLILGSIGIFIYCFLQWVRLVKTRKATLIPHLTGSFISVLLYTFVLYILTYGGETYIFSPCFLLTTLMFILPGICILITKNNKNRLYPILIISVLFSAILTALTFSKILDYLEKSGIIHFYH